jgi:hypothetical protein
MKLVVRPNFDTLYTSGFLDLTKEPVVVSVPDTGGRYYLLPMLDMWTDVFASPGWRTTGTQAGNFLITPPNWRPDLREKVIEDFKLPKTTQVIDAPTPYVLVIGRTKTDGPPDYDAVHKIQAGFKITPLSQWEKAPQPVTATIDPTIDMKTPPKIQVDTMPADKYFAYAAELLKLHPPHVTDEPIIAQMRRLGIEPGKSLDLSKLDPVVQKALASAPEAGQQLMKWKMPTIARVANHWSMNTDTMGVYGNYYLRLALARICPRTRSTRSTWVTKPAVRWMVPTNTASTSTRVPRRLRTHSGRSHCTIRRDSRLETASTASPSVAGCRSSTTPTVRSIFTSRTRVRARTRKPIGFRRRREPST